MPVRTEKRRVPSIAAALAAAAIVLSAGIGAIPAVGAASPSLVSAGAPVGGAPFSVSGSGFSPSAPLRLAIVPRGVYPPGTCLADTPVSVADLTTDAAGAFGTTVAWPSSSPGSWTTLALQGACVAPTATPTPSPTAIATATPTPTPTSPALGTPTPTPTATPTATPTSTPTATPTPTPTGTPVPAPTATATPTATPTTVPTATPTPTSTPLGRRVPPTGDSSAVANPPSPGSSTDVVVRASLDFEVGPIAASIPSLSKWGLLSLAAFLALGGWLLQSRLRA